MAKDTVIVGCRLPNGLVLKHPKNPNVTVQLNGTYVPPTSAGLYVPPRPYGVTVVDAELWAAWKEAYAGFPFLKSQAIFEAHSIADADAKAKEFQKEKTGFEAMPKTVNMDGVRLERIAV